jgi:hypothetical protein
MPLNTTCLPPIRQRVLDLIKDIPFNFPPVYKVNFPSGPPSSKPGAVKGKVTNCGEFPGWITRQIGGSGAPKDLSLKFHDQWGDYSLTAPMTGWETWAKKLQAQRGNSAEPVWIPYSKTDRPQPGDIYVLYGWTDLVIEEKPKKVYGFAHVGFIIDGSGSTWITADCGQGEGAGSGFSGCYQKRTFSDGKLTLQSSTVHSGKPQPDAGTKDIKGWVNLENLFKGWKPA